MHGRGTMHALMPALLTTPVLPSRRPHVIHIWPQGPRPHCGHRLLLLPGHHPPGCKGELMARSRWQASGGLTSQWHAFLVLWR